MERPGQVSRVLGALRRPLPLALTLAVVVVVALGGIAIGGVWRGDSAAGLLPGHATPTTRPVPAVRLKLSPGGGATGVRLDAHAKVVASGGRIRSVRVTGPDGEQLPGRLSRNHTTWLSTGVLRPAARYKVTAVGENPVGAVARRTSSFTTLKPAGTLGAAIMPLDGEKVGVAMPIAIWFDHRVTDKAAVERRLEVETSRPVEGGWRWFNDKEVHYRPKTYWPSGTAVTLRASLAGTDAGDGVWGVKDRLVHFRIGDRHISVVDTTGHQMKVTSNGKTLKVFPMSAGRPKYPTTNGIHFTLEKARQVTMDSATVGIPRDSPDGYYEKVYWNVRISNTGEFVHAAPWSAGSQGSANVSHGCVNLSTANATWFYHFSQRGDVVQVVGSPKQPNGWALGVVDWNMSWGRWLAGSALR
ncbi:MAG TPA: Ig-like domain-containing protein [Actinomycetes bacterium]|jgi:lipoprotein-anchoring transpeptidase ErfK/SrfK|nr:Ig-like domain-containing protein [Actinomycetes bacterium]